MSSSPAIVILTAIIVLAMAAKIVATAVLLIVGKAARDRPGWGSMLWWVTKITPVIAVPCLFWIARAENNIFMMKLSLGLGLFVAVAMPIKSAQRRHRIMKQAAAGTSTQA
jgi:hypothetical protein